MLDGYVDTNAMAERCEITVSHAERRMAEMEGAFKFHGKWLIAEEEFQEWLDDRAAAAEKRRQEETNRARAGKVYTCPHCEGEFTGGGFTRHVKGCNGGRCMICGKPKIVARNRCANCYTYWHQRGVDKHAAFVRTRNSYRRRKTDWESVDEQVEATRAGRAHPVYLPAGVDTLEDVEWQN